MPFRAECPHCGAGFSVGDRLEGKKVNCGKCKEVFEVARKAESPIFAASSAVVDNDTADESWMDDAIEETATAPVREAQPPARTVIQSHESGEEKFSFTGLKTKRYWGLILLGEFYRVFAKLILLFSIAIFCFGIASSIFYGADTFFAALVISIVGTIISVPLFAVKDGIFLALSIEKHIRKIAEKH